MQPSSCARWQGAELPQRWPTCTARAVAGRGADALQRAQDLLAAHTSNSAQAALMQSSHPTANPLPRELEQDWCRLLSLSYTAILE